MMKALKVFPRLPKWQGKKIRLRLQAKILLGFLIPVFLMGIAAAIGYWSFQISIESSAMVNQTHAVIAKANLLIKLAVDAETGQRGYMLTGSQSFLEPYTSGSAAFEGELQALRKLVADDPAQVSRLWEIRKTFDLWTSEVAKPTILRRSVSDTLNPGLLKTLGEGRGKELMDQLRRQVNQFVLAENNLLDARIERNNQAVRTGQIALIVGPAVAALIALLGGFGLAYNLSRNVRRVASAAKAMTAGDLDQQIAVNSSDETGDLARAFNQMSARLSAMIRTETEQRQNLQRMTDQLNETVRAEQEQRRFLQSLVEQAREASENLAQASAEILAFTTQQAAGASQQSAAIAQTTTTVEELKEIAEQARLRASQVNETARRTVSVSQGGQGAVRETIESMEQIKSRVDDINKNILALYKQTQQIGNIIASVSELASQSNMLALNASVEAARAGEQGRGFAVVAAEVRVLAEQSKAATAQIKEILSQIQRATRATMIATEEGAKGVERGVALAGQAQAVIEQLSDVITTSSQAAQQVAAGSQQQVNGIDQVAGAMTSINAATMQNLASTRQMEQAAQNLNALSNRLKDLIALYKN